MEIESEKNGPIPELSTVLALSADRSNLYLTVYFCIGPFQLSLLVGSHETLTDNGDKTDTVTSVTYPLGTA